jgi:hypothetical protein
MSEEFFFIPQVEPKIVTKLAFRYRLTDEEFVGIIDAAQTSVPVRAWFETFNMVSQINLADKRTADGLDALVALGLLEEERVKEIIEAPIQPEERP